MKVLMLCLALCLVSFVNCQEDTSEPLPDSIPEEFDGDCLAQREIRPSVCCELDGSFCCRQCMQGICRCVDPESGMRIESQGEFSDEEVVDCCPATPEIPETEAETETPETEAETPETLAATPETLAATPETEAETPETEAETPETLAATPETLAATPETEAETPETLAATPETEAETPETEAETPETEAETEIPEIEEPTDDDDDDDSESSDSSNTSRSTETSFSDSSESSRSRSESSSTKRTRTTGTRSRSRSTGSRSPGTSRSRPSSRTNTRTRSRSESSSTNRTRTTGTRSRSRSTGSRSPGTSRSRPSSRSRSESSYTNRTRTTGSRSKSHSRSTMTRSRSTGSKSTGSRSTGTSISETSGRCPSVQHLLRNGCTQECLVVDTDECPACNVPCLESLPPQSNEEDECECTDLQECLRTGRFGNPSCVDLPGVGERCGDIAEESEDEESSESKDSRKRRRRERARKRTPGASQRRAVGQLNNAQLPCQDGLVCASSADDVQTCQEQNDQGPCILAQNSGRSVDCDARGLFNPLQCSSVDDSSVLRCMCVLPSDGTTLSGTEVIVTDLDDAPDCSAIVFESCDYLRAGQLLSVPHGEYFADIENCRRCMCNDGEAVECEPSATCTALQVQPRECRYRGQVLRHGDALQFGCNLCGCRNGFLSCTRAAECEDEVADRCSTCGRSRQGLVCAPNGVTYRSECEAVFCAGHPPFTLNKGACKNYDVCQLYPCDDGELCLRKGGVSCFALDGCAPEQLRLCVDPMDLHCDNIPVNDNEDEGDDVSSQESAVCATNGVTYPSLCRLIQDTGKEGVAYSGGCEDEQCSGGPVCGSDGVTYDNVCELRSQSANAVVDYPGQCEDQLGDTPEDVCARVNALGRCLYNTTNCKRLVQPEQGCCSRCGGVVLIAIDFRGLGEYVRLNPRLQTLDDLLEVLLESEFISIQVTERCDLEASLTASGDVQLTLSARDDDTDAEFCWDQSSMLAQAINTPSDSLPEALQFASAAVSAPPILSDSAIGSGSNGLQFSVVIIAVTLFISMISSFGV